MAQVKLSFRVSELIVQGLFSMGRGPRQFFRIVLFGLIVEVEMCKKQPSRRSRQQKTGAIPYRTRSYCTFRCGGAFSVTAAHSLPVHPASKQTRSPNEKRIPLDNPKPAGNNVLPPPNDPLTPAKTLPCSRLLGRLVFAYAQARPQGLRDKRRIPVEEGKHGKLAVCLQPTSRLFYKVWAALNVHKSTSVKRRLLKDKIHGQPSCISSHVQIFEMEATPLLATSELERACKRVLSMHSLGLKQVISQEAIQPLDRMASVESTPSGLVFKVAWKLGKGKRQFSERGSSGSTRVTRATAANPFTATLDCP